MTISRGRFIFVALIAIVLLMSACSSTGGSLNSPTVLQMLQKSVTAMKQLKSAHIDIKLAGTVNVTSTTAATTPANTHQITINITGNGDEVLPSKFALHIIPGQSNNGASNTKLAEIILGRQLFIQNAKGQWYVLSGGRVQGASGNPFAAANISNYNSLLNLAQKAQLTDHGNQPLNGQNLRHITVTFGDDALKDLLNATGQASAQQDTSKLLNETTLQKSTLDIWIDKATSYVHRLELKLNLTVKGDLAHNAETPATSPSPMTTSIDTIIDYSKFNESITITAPPNAIPTNDLLNIT